MDKKIRLRRVIKSIQFSITVIIIGFFSTGKAQDQVGEEPLSPSNLLPMNKMILQQWTGEDGLISNNLNSVKQTSDGFLWVTSFSGVFRFDGKRFKRFDKGNVENLQTNAFLSLSENQNGDLLFASQGSGAFRYSNGVINKIENLNISSLRNILTDAAGNTWYGTTNEGVVIQKGENLTKVDFDALKDVAIMSLYEDRKGNVWFGTGGNGLVKYNQNTFERFHTDDILEDNTVAAIIELASGELIVGSPSGLYKVDMEKRQCDLVPNFKDIDVNDLKEDSTGMLWVASEQGLFRVNTATGYFEVFNEKNGLPGNKISGVHIDMEGSVWLSTRKDGLLRLTSGTVTMLDELDGIINTRINIIYEHQGETYIGCDDGAVYVRKNNVIKPINLMTKREVVGIRDFAIDQDGSLLVASYMGIIRYKNGKEELISTKNGLPHDMIRRVITDNDGSWWLADRTGGMIHYLNNNITNTYTTENGLNSNYILALEKDRNGRIVIGTHSGGLSIINDDSVASYSIPDAASALIFNIHIDNINTYWLCTNIGLYIFKEGIFRRIEFNSSLKTETFFDFIDDQKGNVWLTSSDGIVRVKKNELENFLNGDLILVDADILDNNDGMASKECTATTRSLLTSSGEVWVPTIDGIAIVNPERDVTNSVIPRISITSFVVDGEEVLQENSKIEPGKVRYLFEYSSTSYQAPDKVKFKYQLSGVDKEWVTTSLGKIEYTNLFPGRYTFSVIGSNNSGLWNKKGDQVTFVVKPFFYQTFWFYLLLGLFISLVIYLTWIWRVRRIKAMNQKLTKLNEELDKFVYSASHDLRAPLASMLGLVNLTRISESQETKEQCLELIEKSVGKLDHFIKDIIDYSRNQRVDVVKTTVNIKEELHEIIESLKFLDQEERITCKVDCSLTTVEIDAMRFGVVLRNIIANALLYHDEGKTNQFIHVTCRANESDLEISIEDNGLGMKPSVVSQVFKMFYRGHEDSKGSGLGLYIAKENMDKLNGKINVDSRFGEGTTFTISIPMA